jgi:hypothetical protein
MAPLPGWKPLVDICVDVQNGVPNCHFSDLMTLISNGITDLVLISTLLVVVACVVVGFKLVTAGMRGDSGALKEARGKLMDVIIGYAVILTAWVVVYTITSTLLKSDFTLLVK